MLADDAVLNDLVGDVRRILSNGLIGAEDDLMNAGADSLALVEIAEAASRRLGREIQISEVWDARTVSALVHRPGPGGGRDPEAGPARSGAGRGRWAAPQQRRFYALHRPLETRLSQVVSCQVPLSGQPDPRMVTDALAGVVGRYDALHTVFEERREGLWQVEVDDLNFEVEEIDLRRSGEDWRPKYEDILASEAGRRYDPRAWPLFRCAVVLTIEGTTVLFHAYHLVFDGVSRGVLQGELVRRLEQPEGEARDRAPLSFNYSDYCDWANTRLGQPAYARAREFWLGVFDAGFAPFHLKRLDGGEGGGGGGAGGYVARLGVGPSVQVVRVAKRTGTTAYAVLMASFLGFLLESYADVTVGIPTTGRNHPECRRLIGMFQNNAFVRATRAEYSGFSSFLRVVQERVLRAVENQEFQYDELLRCRGGETALTGVYFNHLEEPLRVVPAEAGRGVHYVIGGRMKAELAANYQWRGSDLVFNLKYDTGTLSRDGIESFHARYVAFLQARLDEV